MLSHHSGRTSILLGMFAMRAALKRAADEVVKRDRAATMHHEVQRRDGPHQRVFETELIPEILADTPAFEIRHDQENEDSERDRPGEQPEREQRAADQLRA